MGLDRPAPPPDQPTPERPADHPVPATPNDPWDVASLTRAQAFESLRNKVAELHAAQEQGEPEQPLADPRAPAPADEPERSRNYWTEAPHFVDQWHSHRSRWPERPSDASQWILAPDQSKEVADSIGRIAAAERTVSDDIKGIEADSNPRGWLEGFSFRLKGRERLQEKIASAYETSSPDATIGEIAERVPDAIRYTFCFQEHDYTAGYYDVKEGLEERGYHLYKSKNLWHDPEYKGINTRWVTAEGQRSEVQFHTPESFHAKHELTHEAYERIRDPDTSDIERRELSMFQREVSSLIPVPDGVSSIADHAEEGY